MTLTITVNKIYILIHNWRAYSWKLFRNTIPFLLSDVVLVDVYVIAKSVKVASEDQRSVHKRAGINQFALLTNFHLFDVEYETAVKDLESVSTLASENEDLVVSDLVGETHVPRDPLGLVQG